MTNFMLFMHKKLGFFCVYYKDEGKVNHVS